MGDPVGRSFEVFAPNRFDAMTNALSLATRQPSVFSPFPRVLHAEQVEAGRWEVVLSTRESPEETEALRFFRFLVSSSDMFDPVAARLALEGGYFVPDEEMMRSLAEAFEQSAPETWRRAEARPAAVSDPQDPRRGAHV